LKKYLAGFISVLLLLAITLTTMLTGCAKNTTPDEAQTITITDQTGVQVTIPAHIERVVSVYPMSTLIIYSLDGQGKLVGIDSNSPKNTVLQEADSNIGNITQVGMPWQVSVEAVLSVNPDVVIGASGDVRKSIESAGIPVIGVNLESPEKLKAGISLIGKCIDKEKEAQELVAYYEQKMSIITNRTSGISEANRIKVLIPNKTGVLSCTGGDSYQNYLIEGAGGVNVAKNVTGQWPSASIEQIMVWNPQVIIVPPYCANTPKDILSDSTWQSIDAVKNGRVYLMPQYAVAWDTPVADSILGELWIAKQLYPEKFTDINISTEAEQFYTKFYGVHYKQ
jgi:iron complex transport system substrate-binding protein